MKIFSGTTVFAFPSAIKTMLLWTTLLCGSVSTALAAQWEVIETFDGGFAESSRVEGSTTDSSIEFERGGAMFYLGERTGARLVMDATELRGARSIRVVFSTLGCSNVEFLNWGLTGKVSSAPLSGREAELSLVKSSFGASGEASVTLRYTNSGLFQFPSRNPYMSVNLMLGNNRKTNMALSFDANKAIGSGAAFNTMRIWKKKKVAASPNRFVELSGYADDPSGNCKILVDRIDALMP